MQGIMPMRLWRRAREAGRAWWAPKEGAQGAGREAPVAPVEAQGGEEEAPVEPVEAQGAGGDAPVAPAEAQGAGGEAPVAPVEVQGAGEEASAIPVQSGAQSGCGCKESACVLREKNRRKEVVEVDHANAALITRLKKRKLKTNALKIENKNMARTVNTLKQKLRQAERAIIDACAPYPEALSKLLPGGAGAGSPNFVEMLGRWEPGLVNSIHTQRQRGASPRVRELAAHGLSEGLEGFRDLEVLGTGNFGVVHAGLSKISNRKVAVKTPIDGIHPMFIVRELVAYAIVGNHENIIDVLCMSDIRGSEGLVMEAAVCDLLSAVAGTSKVPFSLPKIISFEADATEGLAYLHKIGVVHIDFKLANTLICCSPNSPSGFIGKVVDLGMCCGIGELRGARMGTVSHAPPEGFDAEVAASPLDDTFAVGVDVSTILADPEKRAGALHMWTHETLLTTEEKDNLASLRLDGGDTREFLENVTHRTMTDGSFARIMMQPCNFNRALPTAQLQNVINFIRTATSTTPADRPPMAAVTIFLRELSASMAVGPTGPADPHAVEGGDAGPAGPPVSPATSTDRPPMAAVMESRQALTATTAARPASPAGPPSAEGRGADLAPEAEPEGLGEEGGVDHDLHEVLEMMRAVPLPFDSAPLEGGGGGGGEVAEVEPEGVQEEGDLDHDVNEVVEMVRAVPLSSDSPRWEGGGGGGGKVAVPGVALLPVSPYINVCGRLWKPGRLSGGGGSLLTPDEFC